MTKSRPSRSVPKELTPHKEQVGRDKGAGGYGDTAKTPREPGKVAVSFQEGVTSRTSFTGCLVKEVGEG